MIDLFIGILAGFGLGVTFILQWADYLAWRKARAAKPVSEEKRWGKLQEAVITYETANPRPKKLTVREQQVLLRDVRDALRREAEVQGARGRVTLEVQV